MQIKKEFVWVTPSRASMEFLFRQAFEEHGFITMLRRAMCILEKRFIGWNIRG